MTDTAHITNTVLKHFPKIQAIYLFGTFGTSDERNESDVDIALLLDHELAKATGDLRQSDLLYELESLLGKEVDLINLRQVSTVFQFEILEANRLLYLGDEYAIDLFEMLTISYYQKLNEERELILKEILESGRILQP